MPITLEELNTAGQDRFIEELGSIFESSPWIAGEAWHSRPFANRDQLLDAMCRVLYSATPEARLALIRAHPDLVGRAALAGTLSRESNAEQASAGLDRLSPGEVAQFTRLNAAYKGRFGFPFVICVRENRKEAILSGFASRLDNSRDDEIATALGEITKIARLRLHDALRD